MTATFSNSRPASTESTGSPALPEFAVGGGVLPEGVRPDSVGRHVVGGVGVVGTDRLAERLHPVDVLDWRRGPGTASPER
jgi:hypothetical protein